MRAASSRQVRISVIHVFTVLLIVFIVFIYVRQMGSSSFGIAGGSKLTRLQSNTSTSHKNRGDNSYSLFLTAKGEKPIDEVESNVFNYNGYSLQDNWQAIPVIVQEDQLTCEKIFQEWLGSAQNSGIETQFEAADFTLNGYAFLEKVHMYQPPKSSPRVWTRSLMDRYVKEIQEDHTRKYAYWDGWTVFSAMKFHGIENLRGAVIGSQSPWVEAYCLVNRAKHITTVDYQKIKIDHPQMSFMSVMDLVKNRTRLYDTFDFIVTFSSLEHSGLGRYGDALDPFGDVKEMQKLRCLLKPGGMFFLGLPTGPDTVVFNAHRIYGRLRLPFMMQGLELVNVFHVSDVPVNITLQHLEEPIETQNRQFVFVLRKPFD